MNTRATKFYHIGLSLSQNSNYLSSICVIDRNKEVVLLDRFYFSDDIRMFFNNSSFVQNSIVMVSLVPDESLLDGKWRIHSKHYKPINGMFEINRNNWTKRLNERLCDFFAEINKNRADVYRCNLSLLRQSYGLAADYPEKSSLDCKNFQAGLKIKYGFHAMPENLLPSASLEAMLLALFGYDIEQRKLEYKEILEYCGLKAIIPRQTVSA